MVPSSAAVTDSHMNDASSRSRANMCGGLVEMEREQIVRHFLVLQWFKRLYVAFRGQGGTRGGPAIRAGVKETVRSNANMRASCPLPKRKAA